MKYTYVFLGQGRTGTTSLWRMLRDHPQVAPSTTKEFPQFDTIPTIADYNKGFLITNKTKVLLNGLAESKDSCIDFVNQAKKENEDVRVCCIYVLRDAKERLISYYDLINKAFNIRGLTHRSIFTDGKIDFYKLQQNTIQDILEYNYIEEVEYCVGRDNILIVKFGEVERKQNKINEFLEIDNVKLKFPKLNTTNSITPTIDSLRDKIQIMDLVQKTFDKTIKEI
ncbi:MAG: hypothetical protein ACTSX1_02600, partial [Candidatus Heimdallarchaeaceae archaeon]